jgi:multiple sugar transport system ATP-binding protein
VEQTGSPLELYDHPVNQFVDGFIGSPAMNFLPGVLRRANGAARVELADGSSLPAPVNAAAAQDGQKVVYGTRPEHMELAGAGDGVATEVVVVEPTGADTQLFTKIAGVEVTSVFRDRHAFRPGEIIRLRPDPARAHLFDAGSGVRLAS